MAREHCAWRALTLNLTSVSAAPDECALCLANAHCTGGANTVSVHAGYIRRTNDLKPVWKLSGWFWPAAEVIMTCVVDPDYVGGQAAPRARPTSCQDPRQFGPDQEGATTGMLHCAAGSIYCLGAQQIHAIATPSCSRLSRS